VFAGPAIALLTAVLTAALLFAFILTGGPAEEAAWSRSGGVASPAEATHDLTPEFAVRQIQIWQRDLGSRLARAGESVDLTKIPVLLLADRTFERSVKDAAYRQGSAIVFEPSGERTDAIREFVYPGVSPADLQDKLLEVYGQDTLPVFFWIRPDSNDRSSKLVGYYRGYRFERDVEVAYPPVASREPNR
jgi:hypothetical protein